MAFLSVRNVNDLYRSSRPEVFCKKDILRNFAKVHRKAPVPQTIFLIKLQASGLQLY